MQLALREALRRTDDSVVEGLLVCPGQDCLREYPIIDGVPLIVVDLKTYISNNVLALLGRRDLSPTLESLVGDCCGPGSAFDTLRQHLSTYANDHYGDLDPAREAGVAAGDGPGAVVRLLERGLHLAGQPGDGAVVDLGCAVGRTTFELAAALDRPVLGVDLSFAMIQLAAGVLSGAGVRYPRRRVGMVYDRQRLDVALPGADLVDFWVCDATSLPLAAGTVGLAVSLNVIDCLASPFDHLQELDRLLEEGGSAIIATPYDWSAAATPVEAWIGGHSQRGEPGGLSDVVLRSLLRGGGHPWAIESLLLEAEEPGVPWQLRLHDRSEMRYLVHVMALRKRGQAAP